MIRVSSPVRILAVTAVLASAAAAVMALSKPDPSTTPADLFVVDGRACYLAELGSVSAYQYELFYTVYFDCKALPTDPPPPPPPPEVPLLEQIRDQLIESFERQFGDRGGELDGASGEDVPTLDPSAFVLDDETDASDDAGETADAVAGADDGATADAEGAPTLDPSAFEPDGSGDAFVTLIHDAQGPEGPELNQYEVSAISDLDQSLIEQIKVLGCVGEVCRPLALACLDDEVAGKCGQWVKLVQEFDDAGIPTFESALWFQIDRGEGLQKGEDLRIFVPKGLVQVRKTAQSQAQESPELVAVLPRLGQSDKGILASQPLFELSLSPLTDDQQNLANQGGGDAASVYFAGGFRRFRPKSTFGWTYSGNLATAEEVSFSAIRTDLEFAKNLSKTFLPLTFSAGAETNQGFDIVNATARASLDFVLPFNINYSPPDDGYIPNTGPVLRLIGEVGTKVEESAEMAMMGRMPDDFERAGYDLTWTIPVARDTTIDIHAAGLWVFSSDVPDDFHDLWEFTVKTKIGGMDYYLGYQKGEAAPLFQPIETTQAGLLIKFGEKFKCEQQPGAGSKFHCAEP